MGEECFCREASRNFEVGRAAALRRPRGVQPRNPFVHRHRKYDRISLVHAKASVRWNADGAAAAQRPYLHV